MLIDVWVVFRWVILYCSGLFGDSKKELARRLTHDVEVVPRLVIPVLLAVFEGVCVSVPGRTPSRW